MRKNFLFLLMTFVLSIVLVSCGSKAKTEESDNTIIEETEEEEKTEEEGIVGIWSYRSTSYEVKASDPAITAKIKDYIDGIPMVAPLYYVEFTNDGNVNDGQIDDEMHKRGTYSISGDQLSITYDGKDNHARVYEFKVKEDVLLLIDPSADVVDKEMRSALNLDSSVKIEKAVMIRSFIRVK